MYFLPRRVGLARAKELVFTGRPIEADEALAIGLVDEVVERTALIDRAVERARLYAAGPGTAIGLAKSIMSNSFEMSLEEVLQAGAVAQGICYASAEHRAAVEAFLAKAG
jgi:enoyl-CoA hydratase/carnithine racemase